MTSQGDWRALVEERRRRRPSATAGSSSKARLAGDPDTAADHSSTIIARRRAGRTCPYLVQDKTGEYCSRMRDEISARCCHDGRVWLTEGELSRTLDSVIFLR